MAFRSRRLEALFGARFEDLNYQHFKSIEGNAASIETEELDWKVRYKDGGKKDANEERAKDVAALANATGGILVLGMAQDDTTSAASKVVNHPITDQAEREFRQAIASNVFPLPSYYIERLPDPAGNGSEGILLVGVPASPFAPHAVLTSGRPDYAYPSRRGNKTDWLSEPEIATAYRRRFAGSASREERLDAVEFENMDVFEESDYETPLLVISLVPEIAGSMRLDRRSYQELEESVLGSAHIGPNVQRTLREVTVGSNRLQATDSRAKPKIHCEFHLDGSGSWGVSPRYRVGNDGQGNPAGFLSTEYVVVHILNALLTLSEHAAERTGVSGTALVRASLWSSVYQHRLMPTQVTYPESRGAVESLHLATFRYDDHYSLDSTRSARSAIGDSVVLLDSITRPGVGLTQAAAHVSSKLFQTFGLLESAQIRDDGTIRSWAFAHEEESYWLDWCQAHEIPVIRTGD